MNRENCKIKLIYSGLQIITFLTSTWQGLCSVYAFSFSAGSSCFSCPTEGSMYHCFAQGCIMNNKSEEVMCFIISLESLQFDWNADRLASLQGFVSATLFIAVLTDAPAQLLHQNAKDCRQMKVTKWYMTLVSELHWCCRWRWSSAHSGIVEYQKPCSRLSLAPYTSLSAHSVALNGSVCELCRGGMQQTGLEPICVGRFKGNFTTYWRHGHSSF